MNVPVSVTSLYPMALASTNIGIGVGLYESGAILFALALWLAGAFVLVGIFEAVGLPLT